ncbi:MAG: hypothetical protein JNL54_03505 [Kineosporiaceae bacterium]|nr:hypothetical protein [Kineosporiaceae bacterium]
MIAWATGRAESPGESRLRFVLRSLGHQVEVQAAVTAAGRSTAPTCGSWDPGC